MKTVYILQSVHYPNRHYTGITNDLAQRLDDHNNGECHHTAKYIPWRVLAVISFIDDSKAQAFERYLKSGSGRAFSQKHF